MSVSVRSAAFVATICFLPMASALAQPGGGIPLTGSVVLGTRSVDVRGSRTKYREDVNLDDGPRLFDISLNYHPGTGDAAVDDFVLSASNLGGDPFESIHVGVRKYGSYRLDLDRRRSSYFYEDTILPAALASITASTGGDFHHFNFERVRDTAALAIDVSPATRVKFGVERQSRIGESTTTIDIERDEFEFEKPLDEALETVRIGVDHDWQKLTLIFEEEASKFENSSEIFLPGASPGSDAGNAAELQFFFFDQVYDYTSRSHLVRALGRPSERLHVSAFWRQEALDLDMAASERSLGTRFSGAPLLTDLSGQGDTSRDLDQFGVDVRFSVGRRAAVVANARSSALDQQGISLLGASQGRGEWEIDTDGLEVGAELAVAARMTFSAGFSMESRDLVHGASLNGAVVPELHSTDRDGYFARLRFVGDNGLALTASVEDNSIDDPFALAAPSATRRYRITLRYDWDNGLGIRAGAQRTDVENDTSGWAADTDQFDLRLNYRWSRLDLSAGWTDIDLERAVDRLLTGGSVQVPFPVAYAANARQRDLSLRWLATDRLTLGGSFGSYDNRGSFPLERDDHRAWVSYALNQSYTIEARYRDVDFAEDAFDGYDADIVELAFRLDW